MILYISKAYACVPGGGQLASYVLGLVLHKDITMGSFVCDMS